MHFMFNPECNSSRKSHHKIWLFRDFIHWKTDFQLCARHEGPTVSHNSSLRVASSEMEGRHLFHFLKPVTVFCSPQWQKPKYNPQGGHWSSIIHTHTALLSQVLQIQNFQYAKEFYSTKNKEWSTSTLILLCAKTVFGIDKYKVVANGNI